MIKKVIKTIRKEKGFSQKKLADIIGVAQTTLSGYETGYSKPILETVIDIANACDYDIYLINKNNNKKIIIKNNK